MLHEVSSGHYKGMAVDHEVCSWQNSFDHSARVKYICAVYKILTCPGNGSLNSLAKSACMLVDNKLL